MGEMGVEGATRASRVPFDPRLLFGSTCISKGVNMTRVRTVVFGVAVALLVWGGTNPNDLEAQQTQPLMPGLPLRPLPPGGYFIIPVLEGWYDNGDGSITASLGYLN